MSLVERSQDVGRVDEGARRHAEELALLERCAFRIYEDAVKASGELVRSIQGLAKKNYLNLDDYVEAWSQVHYKRNERFEDRDAHWVGQREVAFLGEAEIARGEKIGTDNLQQCVAIIIDGVDREGARKVALAHVDKYTTLESVQVALQVFNMGPGTQIKLYGGRSQTQGDISEANIAIAEEIVVHAIAQGAAVDRSKLRDAVASPNIVYNPIEHAIFEGVLPIKGHSTKEMRLISRRAQNVHMAHDFSDRVVPQRDVPIRTINLANPIRDGLSDLERRTLLSNFSERGCVRSLSDLNQLTDIGNSRQLSEYCAIELKPLGEGVQHSLLVSAGYDIKKSHIYKGSPRVLALCNEICSRGPQVPYQGERRRLLPDAPGENVQRLHRVADDIIHAMNARGDGGLHAQVYARREGVQVVDRRL